MVNLLFRSVMVLALLFGLLFAVGMAVVEYTDAPFWVAGVFALGVLLLQYLLDPKLIEWIYKIEWVDPQSVDPDLADFMARVCAERNIPFPRFGLIRDGNPNAFTFGHYLGDARLVVTTGLVRILDPKERQAVVAHELGHITHWDFVVMTVAAAVPLLLYILYRTTLRGKHRKGKSGSYIALVGLASYVTYILSHYIVLLLSRVREYYADQFAGEVTGKPDTLSGALIKIAYGLASSTKNKDKKDDARLVAGRAFGIFDPRVAQSLAVASAGTGTVSAESMESAMKWDLWNPWGLVYELSSSHPLPAKRLRALERQSEVHHQVPRFSFRAERPESYWDEFAVDMIINALPALGLLLGLAISLPLFPLSMNAGMVGIPLFLFSLGWWVKRRFSYRQEFETQLMVQSLVGEVKVSAVRSIPGTLQGEIIGRGVPGLFYSEDLVVQDETGFMLVDYRQPWRLLEFLFGWIKAESLIGKRGKITGWYRRSPRPYFEMRRMELDNGETITSHYYSFTQFLIYAGMVLGLVLAAAQMVW